VRHDNEITPREQTSDSHQEEHRGSNETRPLPRIAAVEAQGAPFEHR
jgi:hypothetical protein